MKEIIGLVLFIPFGLMVLLCCLAFVSFVVREPEFAAFLAFVGICTALAVCVLGK